MTTCAVRSSAGQRDRVSYLKRTACFLLACILCYGLIQPPKAEAVVVVDDVAIAMLIIAAASFGLVFTHDAMDKTGFTAWLSEKVQGFLATTGKTIEDLFSATSLDFFSLTGKLQLTKDQSALMVDFMKSLASSNLLRTKTGQLYFLYDGVPVFSPTRDVSPDVIIPTFTLADLPYSPMKSLPLKITASPEPPSPNGHTNLLFFYRDIQVSNMSYNSLTTTHFSFAFRPGYKYDSNINLGRITSFAPNSYTYGGVCVYKSRCPQLYNWTSALLDISNSYDWKNPVQNVDGTQLDFSLIDSMVPTDIYTCPDVIGWDATDITASLDKILTKALDNTLAVPATVEIAKPIPTAVPTAIPTTVPGKIGDLAVSDVVAQQSSLGALFLSKFPFSIPWDFANGIMLLASPPKTPYWEVDFFAPIAKRFGGFKGSTKIVIDFKDFELLGSLCRWVTTIMFCTALATGTKRLLWTA